MHISPFEPKPRMGPHPHDQVEIAVWLTLSRCPPLAGQSDALTVDHPWRDGRPGLRVPSGPGQS